MPHKDPEVLKAWRAKHRAANRERIRAYHRDWVDRNREQTRETERVWRLQHPRSPAAVKAWNAVNVAIREGSLVREPCELCSSTHRVEAHHPFTYEEPFAVWWLCMEHHVGMHRAMKEAAA